jgi:L-ribulokinase
VSYLVGVDFGTLSARAVVVDADDGTELGSAVHEFKHGVMERALAATGAELPAQWALQDPADYVEALESAVPAAVAAAGVPPDEALGIGTDFTASTPMPVLADGTPLCQVPGFEDRPHAYVKLWKHHAAQRQADRINALAEERGEAWLPRYGGRISSEWEFAKALQLLEEDPEAYERTDRWIEAADWIVWQLCGRETRSICTAGYKAIHQDGAYPSEDYLRQLDERFAGFVASKIAGPLSSLGDRAGNLTAQAARWTGLPEGIPVAVGNVDAHVTAPAARAIDPGQMLMIMGTSTCHVMNAEQLAEVPGMCGVVRDGIVPGLFGYEAGQTGVGDIFGWLVEHAVPPRYHDEARARGLDLHAYLSQLAGEQPVGGHGLVALDWNNGNRSVLVDHELSGLIVGLTLATRAEDIYRALIEATAFGTRVILDAFADTGVPVRELFAAGGLIRNPVIMQIYADVTRMPLHVIGSEQGPALGSAMHAALAAGLYPDIHAAAAAMGKVRRDAYLPDEGRADAYDSLYEHYVRLHDHFGRGGDDIMHRLRDVAVPCAAGRAGRFGPAPRELARG